MLASTSSASSTLLAASSTEGLKHLYRTILTQARLLSVTLDDPIVFSSHRYLARKNLEPLLTPTLASSTTFPPSTETKRLLRAKIHRRQLADANYGWEHAVHRALSLAYARTGKLRRDALSDLSPTPSSAADEGRYPKQRRKKHFSPVLTALLTSAASMNGAPVKSVSHLTERPPPPWLPAVDDPLVTHYGKATSRRRVANASKRFVKTYLRKVKLPLDIVPLNGVVEAGVFAHLEAKARPPAEHVSNVPRRFNTTAQARSPVGSAHKTGQGKVGMRRTGAREETELYRSRMDSSGHRKRSLRTHGWSSHPKDFTRPRAQRRLYARILDDTPLLIDPSHTPTTDSVRRKNDPLHIRARLAAAPASKLKVVKSRYALGPANSRGKGEVAPPGLFSNEGLREAGEWLDKSELDVLRQNGLL